MSRSKASEAARADRARRVYQFERFNRDNCFRKTAVDYALPACWRPEVWVKLVRFCHRRSIDPAAYIQWALCLRESWFTSVLEPTELLHPARMNAYTADQQRIRRNEWQRRVHETQRFRAHVAYEQSGGETMAEALVIALVLDSLEVSPLFRFGVARAIPHKQFEEIAKIFEKRALFQYQYHADVYDKEWGEPWVQPWFRAAGKKLYEEAIYQGAFDEGGVDHA